MSFFDPSRLLELLNPPAHAADLAQSVMPRLLAGEDTEDLAETLRELYVRLDGQSRLDLVWMCCDLLPTGPLIRGAALAQGWLDGKHGSKITVSGYSKAQVLRWFRSAAPEGMMDAEELAVFRSLPDPVTAYRGAPGPTPKQAASGISWTLDYETAAFFRKLAEGYGDAAPLVVAAEFPRDAVLAYFNDRSEQELVVNYRRARRVRSATDEP